MLLSVQVALAWHAQHIAQTAASRGLADARALDGTRTTGTRAGHATLRTTGGSVMHTPRIEVTRSRTVASVRVEGRVLPVIPGLDLAVRGHAIGPVERFLLPQGG